MSGTSSGEHLCVVAAAEQLSGRRLVQGELVQYVPVFVAAWHRFVLTFADIAPVSCSCHWVCHSIAFAAEAWPASDVVDTAVAAAVWQAYWGSYPGWIELHLHPLSSW